MGRIVWFGAPIMQRMSGLSLAGHWHGIWGRALHIYERIDHLVAKHVKEIL